MTDFHLTATLLFAGALITSVFVNAVLAIQAFFITEKARKLYGVYSEAFKQVDLRSSGTLAIGLVVVCIDVMILVSTNWKAMNRDLAKIETIYLFISIVVHLPLPKNMKKGPKNS